MEYPNGAGLLFTMSATYFRMTSPFELTPNELRERSNWSDTIYTADLDSPCDCQKCQAYEAESMAYAMASYIPKVDADDHDEPCDDAKCGCHDDCSPSDCTTCFEYQMDRAEDAYDAARGH